MIAVDSSTLIAYLDGDSGRDTDLLDGALAQNLVRLPPVVLTEILSAPVVSEPLRSVLAALPLMHVAEGYWERAGALRGRILAHGLGAPLADTLICQSCLDHDLPLLTRDSDFGRFATHGGLALA